MKAHVVADVHRALVQDDDASGGLRGIGYFHRFSPSEGRQPCIFTTFGLPCVLRESRPPGLGLPAASGSEKTLYFASFGRPGGFRDLENLAFS